MGVKAHHQHKMFTPSLIMYLWITTSFIISITHASTTEAVVAAIVAEEPAKVTELKPDLDSAETKDPKKHEIVKQIRRLNQDGSYTVGYETEDGTFKIESRDVLGNVKGTYGYVDANGEIKRVSYVANNSTGLKNSDEELITQTIQTRNNTRTHFSASTTRRPTSLAYLTNPNVSPTRSSVIQSIPRKRVLPYSSDRSTSTSSSTSSTPPQQNAFYITSKYPETTTMLPQSTGDSTTTVVYATSISSPKPTIFLRPTFLPNSSLRMPEQLTRPEKLEIDQISKVTVSSNKETSTSKPVTEDIDEIEPEKKQLRGNHLRRQLTQERQTTPRDSEDQYETQQQIIYSQTVDEEGSAIYGGSATVRPLFPTTNSPRIPAIVIAARQRAALVQNTINNNAQTTSTTTTSTTPAPEKIYANPPRRPQIEVNKNNLEPTTESSSEHSFIAHTSRPIVQIPANRDSQQATDDDQVIIRRRPIPPQTFHQQFQQRDFSRGFIPAPTQRGYFRLQPQQPTQQEYRDDREQYLRETTQSPVESGNNNSPTQFPDDNLIIPPNLPPFREQRRPHIGGRQYFQQQALQNQEDDGGYDQQSYQIPFAQNPNIYQPQYATEYYNSIPERPLTTRDFERLLQLLVLRHQQLQQTARIGYYPQHNPYGPSPIPPYLPYQQIPRPPIYDSLLYNPRSQYYRASNPLRQYIEPENTYQAQNQVPDQTPFEGQRLVGRKKQYNPRYFGAASTRAEPSEVLDRQQSNNLDYLPSNVREDLLYRMLMLAIQSEQAHGQLPIVSPSIMAPNPVTVNNNIGPYSKKPVRSVQILGED